MKDVTRRTLLRYGAAGVATMVGLPTIVPSRVLGAKGSVAPSNQIAIGQVGFGWIGGSHLSTLLNRKEVRYVAACDVNGGKLEEVRRKIEAKYGEDRPGGGFADMGAHHFDIAQWALDMDHSGPTKIYPPDGKERQRVRFEYANGIIMNHVGGNCLGLTFHGSDGVLYVGRDGLWTKPDSIAKEPIGANDTRLYESNDHHGNWIDCMRSRKRCVADVEIGARSATICHLGNIACELGEELHWDPAEQRFIGNERAEKLSSRSMRSPWHT